VLLFVLLVVVVVLIGLARRWRRGGAALGGAPPAAPAAPAAPARRRGPGPDPAASPNVVVDTLNLTHWLMGRDEPPAHGHAGSGAKMDLAHIVAAIDRTAPALKARHPGRVMYVLKDRDSQFNDEAAHAAYQAAAERNSVYVVVAEQYRDPPRGNAVATDHSARGRDDFLVAVLAAQWRCAALTEDRLRDFDKFRATLQPFHTYEFAFWRALPHREFYRPESRSYARLKKPRMVRFADYDL
jgi:hypothetical protein